MIVVWVQPKAPIQLLHNSAFSRHFTPLLLLLLIIIIIITTIIIITIILRIMFIIIFTLWCICDHVTCMIGPLWPMPLLAMFIWSRCECQVSGMHLRSGLAHDSGTSNTLRFSAKSLFPIFSLPLVFCSLVPPSVCFFPFVAIYNACTGPVLK